MRTWNLLRHLYSTSSLTWLCGGDFSGVLCQQEKRGGNPKPAWCIRDFSKALADNGLTDLGFFGSNFTWCNRRLSLYTGWERQDHFCAFDDWRSLFCNARVEHVDLRHSNYATIILHINPTTSPNLQWRHKPRFTLGKCCLRILNIMRLLNNCEIRKFIIWPSGSIRQNEGILDWFSSVEESVGKGT